MRQIFTFNRNRAHGRLTGFATICLALAGCGPRYQSTPEPGDERTIMEIAAELGTDRTYDSRTLLMNPEPDGALFLRWMDRREQTLQGRLDLYRTPALTNPGLVKDTIEWERRAEKAERGVFNPLFIYMRDASARTNRCPMSAFDEKANYDKKIREHSMGMLESFDWDAEVERLEKICDDEFTTSHPVHSEPKATLESISPPMFNPKEAECKAKFETVNQAYIDNPNEETGRAQTEARNEMVDCLKRVGSDYHGG